MSSIAYGFDPIRENTPLWVNEKIDRKIEESIRYYANTNKFEIHKRLRELKRELGIERTLEINAAVFSLTGLILGTALGKKWFVFPAMVTTFILQHALRGWSVPMAILRRFGLRTEKEIERETVGLMELLSR